MSKRILLLGATGTIGAATLTALQARGHAVTCLIRPQATAPAAPVIRGDLPTILTQTFTQPFDAVVSCMASRTGAPADAWAVDHAAHSAVLSAAKQAGVAQFTLLSAICVQKPLLAFQHAKLAFEAELQSCGLTWSIVRPTAYFKSLSGQLNRLRAGKPFLLFGKGDLTACKPISDADLGHYLADTLTNPALQNNILPIGGPGPALTSRQMGDELFRLLHLKPKFTQVPVALMDAIIATLATVGTIHPGVKAKAELARIGRYYATESMLVWNPASQAYDAGATPETGSDTLFDFYARLVRGEVALNRGDHAVF